MLVRYGMYYGDMTDTALKEKWGAWYYYFFPEKQVRASAMKEYQYNYQQWLGVWLKNTYRQLAVYLGNGFEILFDRYLRQFPLATSDIKSLEYDFLSVVKQNASLFYDIGVVDWLLSRNQFIPDEPPFPFTAFSLLTSDDFQKVTFRLSKTFSLFESSQPLDQIWVAYKKNQVDEGLDSIFQTAPEHYGTCQTGREEGIGMKNKKSVYAITKFNAALGVVKLCPEETALARMLIDGARIYEIPIESQAFLPVWIEKKRIVSFCI